jgi:hypothetical protein
VSDPRIGALADCEAIIAAHQPDDAGTCRACAIEGEPVRYPCLPLRFTEDAAERLRRRVHQTRRHHMNDLTSTGWRTSSFSNNTDGNRVEVKSAAGAFAVRDTMSPDGPILVFGAHAWHAFLAGVQAGEFDQ